MVSSRHWIARRAKLVASTALGATAYAHCVKVGKHQVQIEQGVFPAHLDLPASGASASSAVLAQNLATNWTRACRALRRMLAQGRCVHCVAQALSQTKLSLLACHVCQRLPAQGVHVHYVTTDKLPMRTVLSAKLALQEQLD